MFKFANYFWIVILAGIAVGLFQLKSAVQNISHNIKITEKKIEDQHLLFASLEAEWAHLRRPERLQDLSTRFLDLEADRGTVITALETIPIRSSEAEHRSDNMIISPDNIFLNEEHIILPSPEPQEIIPSKDSIAALIKTNNLKETAKP